VRTLIVLGDIMGYTVYFIDGTSVEVIADSLEEAEQAAHEIIGKDTPVDVIVPNVGEP
jgi:hypothetical protein